MKPIPCLDLSAGAPRAAMARSLVAILACACALCVANVYYAQPLLDTMAGEFGISQAAAGGVITATQAGSALSLVLLVPLGDMLERRTLMLAQLTALVVALAALACASSGTALLAAMLAVGLLGTAMTQGLIAYAAAAASPAERGAVVGAAQGGVMIGLLSARVAAGLIADLAGWRAVYAVSSLAMLGLAIVLWSILPRQAPPARPLPYRHLLVSMLTLLRRERALQIRGVLALLLFAALSVCWSALVLPLTGAPHRLSHSAVGAFGLVGVAGAMAAARAGAWADRGFGQRTTAVALLLLLAAWLPLWFTTSSLWALALGVILLDLGAQAIHVTNQSMIFSAGTHAHSRLVACYMLFYAAGSGLGAIGSTAAYAAFGWSGVCLLGAATSLAALLFWLATLARMPLAPSTAHASGGSALR